MELQDFVEAFGDGLKRADRGGPVALNKRSGSPYSPGIGPHTESETISLVLAHTSMALPPIRREVPYPNVSRSRCDVVVVDDRDGWVIEVKMLRMMGDNGKPNDNMLMHILSPYARHRSAVTDCAKLLDSGFKERKAIVIFGYEYDDLPMSPAIEAFELLASQTVQLCGVEPASIGRLVHPVHRRGQVFAWEIGPLA